MTPKQQYKPGERKISETFLRFAAPILEDMPEEATASEIEKVLTPAVHDLECPCVRSCDGHSGIRDPCS